MRQTHYGKLNILFLFILYFVPLTIYLTYLRSQLKLTLSKVWSLCNLGLDFSNQGINLKSTLAFCCISSRGYET